MARAQKSHVGSRGGAAGAAAPIRTLGWVLDACNQTHRADTSFPKVRFSCARTWQLHGNVFRAGTLRSPAGFLAICGQETC